MNFGLGRGGSIEMHALTSELKDSDKGLKDRQETEKTISQEKDGDDSSMHLKCFKEKLGSL